MRPSRCSAPAALRASLLVLAPGARTADVRVPEAIEAGGTRLLLNGQGTRSVPFFVELYSVALYLPRRASDPEHIRDDRVPKACPSGAVARRAPPPASAGRGAYLLSQPAA